MKMLYSLLLSLAMIFMLVACGQETGSEISSRNESQNVTEITTTLSESDESFKSESNLAAYETICGILEDSQFCFLDETEVLAPYYAEAEARKKTILSSSTEIAKSDIFIPGETYTGTAWYISPSGNDENDGRTPETAWKTAHRANWGDVQPGDAVFFERGGVYRLLTEPIRLINHVTYSAYGEGAKPVITISQENSAREECWDLYYEGGDGEKIWLYYQKLGDVGGIVLDDEAYAKRILEWPTPEGWLAVDVLPMDPVNGVCAPEDPCTNVSVQSAGEYRTVEQQLTENLTYISRTEFENLSYPIDFHYDCPMGALYLRCDDGNPGDCFDDIEIMAVQQARTPEGEPYSELMNGYDAEGFVLDNLSLKYYLDNAVYGSLEDSKNAVIQNCTVEWGGNRLHIIQSAEPTYNFYLIGDGIYCVANNVTIRNNYIRHSGNGFTFENSMETPEGMGTYLAEGNLMENCGQGIRTYFIEPSCEDIFDALILRNNIILQTGDGMNNACMEEPVAIDLGHEAVRYAKKIEVSDNVAIGSTLSLLRLPDSTIVDIAFSNNFFAQDQDGVLITEIAWNRGGVLWHMMENAKPQ